MTKQLTPLKELGFIKGYCLNSKSPYFDMLIKKFEIIETELKRLEEYEKCGDLKDLQYISTHKVVVVDKDTYDDFVKNCQEKNKQDEILRIIKEKKINVAHILSFTINSYNRLHNDNQLTQEQFDLLKEELEHE